MVTFNVDDSVSREQAVNDIAKELGRVMRNHLDECTKCCPNCLHWQERAELCNLVNARPPARIIAFGCELYDDRIPF